MKRRIKLLLVKASPTPEGVGCQLFMDLKVFITRHLDCQLVTFDQADEAVAWGQSSPQQFIEAGPADESKFERQLMASDGILILSPVYLRQMPGEFKMTLDRFSYRMHEFPLLGKKLVTAVYCNSNGADDLSAYFKTVFTSAGAELVAAEEYYQAGETYEAGLNRFKTAVRLMYERIENNVFQVTKQQEQLFQYYKNVVAKEKEQGIRSNRQKRWADLAAYDSLCDYIRLHYIRQY